MHTRIGMLLPRIFGLPLAVLWTFAPAAAQQYIHSDERREQLQKLVEAHQPPGATDAADQLNAFALLRDVAFAAAAEINRAQSSRPKTEFPILGAILDDEPPTPAQLRRAESLMRILRDRSYFARMDHLAGVPRAVRPAVTPERAAEFRADYTTLEFVQSRRLSSALEARMVAGVRGPDSMETAFAYRGMLAIGRIFAHQLSTSDRLIAQAFVIEANRRLRAMIAQGELPEPVLRACAAALEEQTAQWPPLTATVQAERIIAPESFAELEGDQPATLAGDDLALLNRILDAFAVLAATPVVERHTAPPAIAAQALLDAVPRRPGFQVSVASSADIAGGVLRMDAEFLADVAATRIMIAAERYRLAEGSYPETLAALTPVYLDSLVPKLGASYPLIYERKDRSYTLYSTGSDMVDDDGEHDPDQPDRAFRPGVTGIDYVYR